MKVTTPGFKIEKCPTDMLHLEKAARVCYKSEAFTGGILRELLKYMLSQDSLMEFATKGVPEKMKNSKATTVRLRLDKLTRNLGRRHAPDGPLGTFWDTAYHAKKHYRDAMIKVLLYEIGRGKH